MRLERMVAVDVARESWEVLRDPLLQAAGGDVRDTRIDDVRNLEDSFLSAPPSLVVTSLDAAPATLELLRESAALVPVLVLVPRRSVGRALELLDHSLVELLPVPKPSIFDVRRALASLDRRIDDEQRCRELEARLRETREALRGAEASADALSEKLRGMGQEKGSPEQEYTRRRIEESIDMAQRYGVPLTCLLVALEPVGHAATPADADLARIAGRLKRCVRSTDLMTLDAEDRFLIVSPFTDRRSAEALARRLREEIRDDPQVRLRVGIAALDDVARDGDALTRRAAEALEHARRQDRGIESL